jgi:hypothetical protein
VCLLAWPVFADAAKGDTFREKPLCERLYFVVGCVVGKRRFALNM